MQWTTILVEKLGCASVTATHIILEYHNYITVKLGHFLIKEEEEKTNYIKFSIFAIYQGFKRDNTNAVG